MIANILIADTPNPGDVAIGQNSFFSEGGNVAYQFKGNHEMQQHGSKIFCLLTPSPPTPGDGSVGRNQLFQNLVMLHIKLRRITHTW